jgi:hypothetical protein
MGQQLDSQVVQPPPPHRGEHWRGDGAADERHVRAPVRRAAAAAVDEGLATVFTFISLDLT